MPKESQLLVQLINKVHSLENRIEEITKNVDMVNFGRDTVSRQMTDQPLSRVQSRDITIQKLRMMLPGMLITAANRAQGGGILIRNLNKNLTLIAKFSQSRLYTDKDYFAWFSIKKDDVLDERFNLYIFNVNEGDSVTTFVMTRNEFQSFIQQKVIEDGDMYHIFLQKINGKVYDVRNISKSIDRTADQPAGIDFTPFLSSWDTIIRMLGFEENQTDVSIITDEKMINDQIEKILNSSAIVPLGRADFYDNGKTLFMIQNAYPSKNWMVDKDIQSKIHFLVIHLRIHPSNSIDQIMVIFDDVKKKINDQCPFIMGISSDQNVLPEVTMFAY